MTDTFRATSDRIELHELVARYAFIIDDADWDHLDNVFTPDAVCDFTDVVATMPVMHGIPAIRECFEGMEHPVGHYITGILTEAGGDDDTMIVRTKQVAVLRGGKLLLGEYLDRAVRTNAGWRLAERRTLRPRAYRKAPS